MRRALITGVTGQDGSFLAELLLSKGYQVHGLIRRSSNFNTQRVDHLYEDPHENHPGLTLHYGDLTDGSGLQRIVETAEPDEIYHLAAQSHVKVSFEIPEYTVDAVATGAVRLLESVRRYAEISHHPVRFYNASSSEMFGDSLEGVQDEGTAFRPRSPYAAAKVFAHWITTTYREGYGLHASNGILFNHESPRRGETFVTRKITRAAARIKLGLQSHLFLGNLDARRDWGYAGDYVEAMWLMLQQETPDDYVVATGEDHSVREFAQLAFSMLDLDYEDFVRVDSRYFRPAEVSHLRGSYGKAASVLGWMPRTSFVDLVRMMVDSDLALAEQERYLLSAYPKAVLS